MIMIDSDIIIWLLRGKDEYKEQFKKLILETDGMIFITPIQVAEIYAGLRKNEKKATDAFFNSLIHISIDKKIGMLSGNYMQKYRKSHNVTLADSIIAASAKMHELEIWTLNKKHYPMFNEKDFV